MVSILGCRPGDPSSILGDGVSFFGSMASETEVGPKPIVFDPAEFEKLMTKLEGLYMLPNVQHDELMYKEVNRLISHVADVIGRNYQTKETRDPMNFTRLHTTQYGVTNQADLDKFFGITSDGPRNDDSPGTSTATPGEDL